jgi:endonuclease G
MNKAPAWIFVALIWRRKLIVISALTTLGIVAPATSQHSEIHCQHFFYGYPAGSPATNDLLIRDIYALSNNDDTKFADWVAYRIDASTVDGPSIGRNWKTDLWLDANETLEPNDYKDAHANLKTDRGHQAPLAAFRGTGKAHETNYLSNITPQKSDLNQGPWVRLENAVRDLARSEGVYVMTGPVYERDMPSLPKADETHKVPSGYWKIIAIEGGSGVKVAAFFFDQETARSADICDHLTTIDAIETKTGLEFLWQLNDTVEATIESGSGDSLKGELGCSGG